eukprot:evm.model.NODE_15301_length_14779_cov_26.990324.6
MPRALFCITKSTSLQSLQKLMPGLLELVLFLRCDKEYARLHQRKRRRERRALHAQHLIPYEQFQREEEEEEEIDKLEECGDGMFSFRSSGLEDAPKLEVATLTAFSRLKKLTVILDCQFHYCLPSLTSPYVFRNLSSLEIRIDRNVGFEDNFSMNSIRRSLGCVRFPALKVLDLEGVQLPEMGGLLSYPRLPTHVQTSIMTLESLSIRSRPEKLIKLFESWENHADLRLRLKSFSLTLHGPISYSTFLDECLSYPLACSCLLSLPFVQITVTGNRREKQARNNATSFWGKTDKEGLKRQQFALLFDAYGPGECPEVPQAVVDLLSNPKRTLPTLAIFDGLETLLRECPVAGLEGMFERVPIIADAAMSTLHSAAAPAAGSNAAATVRKDEMALTLGRISTLVSIRRADWLNKKKSFSLLFATALVERGVVKILLQILAQGKDKEGEETATSVMFLFRALPIEAFLPEGRSRGGGRGRGGGGGGGGGQEGGVTIPLLLCLLDIVVSRHARQDIRRLWNLSVLLQLFKMCPFTEVVLPVVAMREEVVTRAILSCLGVGHLKAWGTSSQGGRLVHPAVGMMKFLIERQRDGRWKGENGGPSFVMRMRESVMSGGVMVERSVWETRPMGKLKREEEEREGVMMKAWTVEGRDMKGKKRGRVEEEGGKGAKASAFPKSATNGSSSSSSNNKTTTTTTTTTTRFQ